MSHPASLSSCLAGDTADNPTVLHSKLADWQASNLAIVISDVQTGFVLARFTGNLTELLREDDHLVVWIDDESYLAIYDDMIGGGKIDDLSIDLQYAAGNIEITKRS